MVRPCPKYLTKREAAEIAKAAFKEGKIQGEQSAHSIYWSGQGIDADCAFDTWLRSAYPQIAPKQAMEQRSLIN